MENKLTAVEWIQYQCQNAIHWDWDELFKQAKAMEKEQIVFAYSNGWHDGQDAIIDQVKHIDKVGDEAGLNYYNESCKIPK